MIGQIDQAIALRRMHRVLTGATSAPSLSQRGADQKRIHTLIDLVCDLEECWLQGVAGAVLLDEARRLMFQAAELSAPGEPLLATIHNNLGVIYKHEFRLAEAERHLNKALTICPDHAHARWSRAVTRLTGGNLRDGFGNDFSARFDVGYANPKFRPTAPWDGSRLADRTLLLRADGGLGDALQFLRYAPMIKDTTGARIIVEGTERLRTAADRRASDRPGHFYWFLTTAIRFRRRDI